MNEFIKRKMKRCAVLCKQTAWGKLQRGREGYFSIPKE
jgi:hypothetical protein